MSRMFSVYSGVQVVLLVLILTLGCVVIAQAQEGPSDDAYGNPADIPAVAATDTSSASASGGASASGASASGASASGSASASGGGGVAAATVLPSTGGASLFALGVGVLLVGSGLVAHRMMR